MDSLSSMLRRELRKVNSNGAGNARGLKVSKERLQQIAQQFDDRITACENALLALDANAAQLIRVSLPAMTALSPPDVQTLPWPRRMPQANYETYIVQDAISVIGASSAVITAKNRNGVMVTTTAGGVIPVNTQILVVGWSIQSGNSNR